MNFQIIEGLVAHSDPASQSRALQYFEHLKNSSDGWKLCIQTLISQETIQKPDYVKFFCLQVVEHFVKQKYPQCLVEDQVFLRDFLAQFTQLQCSLDSIEKSFILNKAAQVFGLMFLVDYPYRWPTFFSDLLNLIGSGHRAAVDFYLRILLDINSEVADREIIRTQRELERNTLIKDAMRDDCVPKLVESWHSVMAMFASEHPEVVCLCLEVLGGYVAWVDIELIANERFVSLLVPFFSMPEIRESACDCVYEIIAKGMEPAAKTNLVESFASVLERAGILSISNNSFLDQDEDFVSKLARLLNGMGQALLASWNKLLKGGCSDLEVILNTTSAIQRKVPLLLQFLSHEDDDVSLAICEFARDYIQFLKQRATAQAQASSIPYGPEDQQNAEALLFIVIKKYKYDAGYNFRDQGEDEAEFDEYRKSLKVLFDNLAQLDRKLVLEKTKEMVMSTLQSWRTLPFFEVEVAITYLYLLGEALPAVHGNHFVTGATSTSVDPVMAEQATHMMQMMKMLVGCGVSTYAHVAVTLQYFETIARYEKFFLQEQHHIPEVLIAFMDERGLRNSNPRVRSRTSYLFSRFIKCLKAHVQGFTEEILKRLQDLLFLADPFPDPPTSSFIPMHQPLPLSPDDQLYLYEASAILIVSSQFEGPKKQLLLKNLLMPVLLKFENLLARVRNESDPHRRKAYIDSLSHAMAVTSRTSKAFSNQQTMKNCGCVPVYLDTLRVFLQALEVSHDHNVLQSSIRQFLHRMVVCLEEEILPFIPTAAEQLLKEADMRSIQEFIPLINQIITKFKKEIVPFLQRVFAPLVGAIFLALNLPIEENDEQAKRERQMLQRSYFLFISALLTNNITEVISQQDSQNMEQVVSTVIQGAVSFPDPVAQKTCFGILRKMVELWGVDNSDKGEKFASPPGFIEFMYKSIVPACFEAPAKATFDLTDAQTVLALSESALCMKTIHEKRGDELILFLKNQFLPSLNFSSIQIEEYCQALVCDVKVFKKYIKGLFQGMRKS